MTTKMKELNQFFTPNHFSQIMINGLKITEPKKIIDLSMGNGSLLLEAQKRWKNSKFFGNDIDKECCRNLSFEKIQCFNYDLFQDNSIKKLNKQIGKVSLCLGNPPFDLIKNSYEIKKILEKFSLADEYKSKLVPTEVLFILQCLNILEIGGMLSVILPDGFFVNNSYKKIREFLLTRYSILEIMELPAEIFEHTKAKTHILTLTNVSSKNKTLELSSFLCTEKITITVAQAIDRMDYGFYANKYNLTGYNKLSSLDVEVFRGIPRYRLKDFNQNHILHTTNFKKTYRFKSALRTTKQIFKHKDRVAQKGDIIIPRVGSNILGRVGTVEKGYFIATDCLFIIRAKQDKDRENIENTLSSQFGKNWIASISKGVGARHITLADIWSMPIIDGENKG